MRAGSEVDEIRRRVKDGVTNLRGLEIGDELGTEILYQLVDGRKTTSEIVELIYGLRSDDEGFKTSYGKVRREIRRLESKGLISRRLLGRDKPYRLTEFAVANLARIGGQEKQLSLVPWYDVTIYLMTLLLSTPVLLQVTDLVQFPEAIHVGLFTCLAFLLGASSVEILRTLRRVF